MDSSIEGLFDGLCHGITEFNQLKERKLWLSPSHCWSAHKNGALQANQDHHWCSGASRSHPRRGSMIPRPPRLYCYQPGFIFYLKVLVIALLLSRDQTKTFYSLPPSNWPPNREVEQHNRSLPPCFRQLWAERLGKTPSDGWIRL